MNESAKIEKLNEQILCLKFEIKAIKAEFDVLVEEHKIMTKKLDELLGDEWWL